MSIERKEIRWITEHIGKMTRQSLFIPFWLKNQQTLLTDGIAMRIISLKHRTIVFLQSLDRENMVSCENKDNLVCDFSSLLKILFS